MPISSADKADQKGEQFAVSQFVNRLPSENPNRFANQFQNEYQSQLEKEFQNQFPVLSLALPKMTGEPTGFCADCNNNPLDSSLNGQTIGDTKYNPNNPKQSDGLKGAEARKRRREIGNRGYVKKMRKIPFLGIFCAILYAFFMSTSVALLKIVPNLHPIAVLVYR